jgi:ribosomal protein S18 acetylase RimI-like enzyme
VPIRAAETADLGELSALDRSVFGELAYPYFVLRQLFDVHREFWLVAPAAGELVGYSLGVPSADRSTGWLLGLGVRVEHRRRGYGRALTAASLRRLRAAGVHDVRLTVEPDNQPAVALYLELGFTDHDYRRDYLGRGEDRLIMRLAC